MFYKSSTKDENNSLIFRKLSSSTITTKSGKSKKKEKLVGNLFYKTLLSVSFFL